MSQTGGGGRLDDNNKSCDDDATTTTASITNVGEQSQSQPTRTMIKDQYDDDDVQQQQHQQLPPTTTTTKTASPTNHEQEEEDDDDETIDKPNLLCRALEAINFMPRSCRYDPDNPPQFTLSMNILLAFATTFTVANLYYPQPILNIIAEEFDVSYERASNVATLSQAGYAVGLAFLCPLADMVPRRPFILFLIWATATVWLGLCLTNNFNVFLTLSFICGFGTVTPQLMLPLVGDLAPPHRRASALSVVVSGLALGLLIARVLSGIVANFTHWRNIYWIAFGAQYLTFALVFSTLPDYPAKNKGLRYLGLLRDILVLIVTEPLVLQACITGFFLSAAFTSFWTTLTFLLSSPPYNYSPLEVGLFAFIGIAVVCLAPVWSRLVTDRFVLLFSVILGLSVDLAGIIIGTLTGERTVAGPIIQAIFMDTGAQFAHTANRANIYGLDPRARNRINTAYMLLCFAGQLTGTAVGNRLYAEGGWMWSGGANIAFLGTAVLVCFVRGPREKGWFGWSGGWNIRKNGGGGGGGGKGSAEGEKKEGGNSESVMMERDDVEEGSGAGIQSKTEDRGKDKRASSGEVA